MGNPVGQWQVDLNGELVETDFETVKRWIAEGRMTAGDKVKKGGLNWISAGRVPALRAHFQQLQHGVTAPRDFTHDTEEATPPSISEVESNMAIARGSSSGELRINDASDIKPSSEACRQHPLTSAEYVCRVCQSKFCAECPQFVGSSRIPTCPLCGDLCQPIEVAQSKDQKRSVPETPSESHFGWNDFRRALRYPFRFPAALVISAALYGFLHLGSIIGMRSGLMAVMLANGLLFGCLTQVVKQVAWGRFEKSFLAGFDSFSIWDNAIRPTLFGFGIIFVTFGPFLLLLVALLTGWLGNPAGVPLTPAHVQNEIEQQKLTPEDLKAIINSDNPAKDEEVMKKLDRLRPSDQVQEMVKEKTPQSSYATLTPVVGQFLTGSPTWLLGLFFLCLLWAVTYYPMALAIAGYSEDFGALLNPSVGLDTIRRMGTVYWKVFLMYTVVQGSGLGLALTLDKATRFMTLPFMGNLPGRILDAIVTFYSSLVVAYLLGLSLHDRAAELNIPTD